MANRYWVGGSGSWNNASNTNWSATSGGAGGATAPTSADDVFFDSGSAAGNYTVTVVSGTLNFRNLNIAKPASGILTFSGTPVINCNGSLDGTGSSGNVTWSIVGAFNFVGTGSFTVTTGGILFDRFNFNSAGGTWTLQDTLSVKVTFGLTSGTVALNEQTVNTPILGNSGVAAKTWNMGTNSVINITGNNTSVVGMSVASGMTITGTGYLNLNYSGSVGTRNVAIGATASGQFNIKVSAGSDIVTIPTTTDLDFTGFTGTLTNSLRTVYGNLTLGTGMTVTSGANGTTFASTGASKIIKSNGVTCDIPIAINSTNPVLLGDALAMTTRTITVNTGGLTTNGYALTTAGFASTNTNTRAIDISNSTVTLLNAGTPWNTATTTNLTFTGTGSTIVLANNTTSARTFSGGNNTYGNIVIGGATATCTTSLVGNFTMGVLSSTKTVAHTVMFNANQTVTMSGWTVSGSVGAVVNVTSFTNAVHNLVLIGGGTVNTVDYLNISYSNATPAPDVWYPGLNSTKGASVTGWMFPSAGSTGNFFLLF